MRSRDCLAIALLASAAGLAATAPGAARADTIGPVVRIGLVPDLIEGGLERTFPGAMRPLTEVGIRMASPTARGMRAGYDLIAGGGPGAFLAYTGPTLDLALPMYRSAILLGSGFGLGYMAVAGEEGGEARLGFVYANPGIGLLVALDRDVALEVRASALVPLWNTAGDAGRFVHEMLGVSLRFGEDPVGLEGRPKARRRSAP